MFFFKSREQKKAAAEEARQGALKKFNEQVDAAGTPAEGLDALKRQGALMQSYYVTAGKGPGIAGLFSKKAREESKATAENSRQQLGAHINAQIEAAGRIADPAERFIRLEEITQGIDALSEAVTSYNRQKSSNKFYWPYLGTAVGWLGAVAGVVTVMHFPPAALAMGIPGVFGGIFVGHKVADGAKNRAEEESWTFMAALQAGRDKAAAMSDAILGSELETLGRSEKFKDLLQRAPRVHEHFTQAFAKKLAEDKPQEPAPKDPGPKPQGGQGGFRL